MSNVLSLAFTRRQLTLGAAAGAAALAGLSPRTLVRAQAMPAAAFAALGYPALTVTITGNGYTGLPPSLPAGRYLLTATADPSAQTLPGRQPPTVAFVSPSPAGVSTGDFLPLFGEVGQAPADPVYHMKFAGGTIVPPGQVAQAVVDLTAGGWLVWDDNPSAPQVPVTFKVTGAFPAAVPAPDADLTATLVDFAITLEGSLTAGPHTLKVQHHGAQPHFLELVKGPDTMTKAQVAATFAGLLSGTPAANAIPADALQVVYSTPTQSLGAVTWHQVTLAAGTYFAGCYFPAAGTGVPDALTGMFDVFTVSG